MALADWQHQIAEFTRKHTLNSPPEHRTLDLASEVGELCKEMLRGSEYGKRPFAPTPQWESEIGDALFALICLANVTEVNLEDALQEAIERLKTRLDNTGTADSSGRKYP